MCIRDRDMAAEEMAEGGEDMGMGMGAEGAANEGESMAMAFFDEEKFGESSGAELLPKLLIECLVLHPYVNDLVRS